VQVAEPDLVKATTGADIFVFVLPHQFVEKTCVTIRPLVKKTAIAISLIKVSHLHNLSFYFFFPFFFFFFFPFISFFSFFFFLSFFLFLFSFFFLFFAAWIELQHWPRYCNCILKVLGSIPCYWLMSINQDFDHGLGFLIE
jgi:hypothetical protein